MARNHIFTVACNTCNAQLINNLSANEVKTFLENNQLADLNKKERDYSKSSDNYYFYYVVCTKCVKSRRYTSQNLSEGTCDACKTAPFSRCMYCTECKKLKCLACAGNMVRSSRSKWEPNCGNCIEFERISTKCVEISAEKEVTFHRFGLKESPTTTSFSTATTTTTSTPSIETGSFCFQFADRSHSLNVFLTSDAELQPLFEELVRTKPCSATNIRYSSSGERYTGPLLNGKKNGKGRLKLPHGVIFEGKWENDKRVPSSKEDILIFPSKDSYQGGVNHAYQRHGVGTFYVGFDVSSSCSTTPVARAIISAEPEASSHPAATPSSPTPTSKLVEILRRQHTQSVVSSPASSPPPTSRKRDSRAVADPSSPTISPGVASMQNHFGSLAAAASFNPFEPDVAPDKKEEGAATPTTYFTCEWVNDQIKSGVQDLTYIYDNGKAQMVGRCEFVDKKFVGSGTVTYSCDGSDLPEIYIGGWTQEKREGFGKHTDLYGVVYEGAWRNNMRHGKGVEYYETTDGGVYTGTWKFDHKHGVFTFEWPDGLSSYREYQMGKLVADRPLPVRRKAAALAPPQPRYASAAASQRSSLTEEDLHLVEQLIIENNALREDVAKM